MNTSNNRLTKDVTRTFFGSDEGYRALERHWSALVNSPAKKTLGPEHHLLYQALRGKDWRKGFAPITNQGKRDNGAFYDWGLCHALRRLHANDARANDARAAIADELGAQEKLLVPFAVLIDSGVLDAQVLQKVRSVLPGSVPDFEVASAYEVSCNE